MEKQEETTTGDDAPRCSSGKRLANDPNSEFDVSEYLDQLLEEENKKPWSRKKNAYHPSAMKGCKRSLYYDRIGVAPVQNIGRDLRMLFDIGHSLHDCIQGKLGSGHTQFDSESKAFDNNLSLYGSCDGVFVEMDWILEIKTVGESGFRTLTRPKTEHLWQVHCYMWCFDIPRAQILYMNRNSGKRRNFRVYFDLNIWEEIEGTINFVENCVALGTPPEKEISSYSCRSCKFAYECKPEGVWIP